MIGGWVWHVCVSGEAGYLEKADVFGLGRLLHHMLTGCSEPSRDADPLLLTTVRSARAQPAEHLDKDLGE